MAVLIAAAVIAGSMDISMLTVRAQEENISVETVPEMTEDVEMEPEAADGTGIDDPDMLRDTEADQTPVPEGEDVLENAGAAAEMYEDTAEAETGEAVDRADASGDGDTTPTGPQKAVLSGITVTGKIYDGSPAVASGLLKAVVPREASSTGREEDVTAQVGFKYSVSGTKDDGSAFSTPESVVPSGNIVTGMPKDAGIYVLTISLDDPLGNYTATPLSVQFKITKKTITIKVKDARKKIGDPMPVFDYTVTGLVGEDALEEEPKLDCDATGDKTGTYLITASGAKATFNYIINYIDGILTISDKEEVTISGITMADKVYDSEPVECDISGVKVTSEGAEVTGLTLKYSISGGQKDSELFFSDNIADNRPTEAGNYTLKVTVESDRYHGELRKDFVISQKPVMLRADDMDIKQGDEIPEEFTFTVEGLLNNDEIRKKPTYTCDINNTEKTGKYPIIPRNASAGANYVITYVPGTLTVLEKDKITITGITTTPAPKVYDGSPVVCNTGGLKAVLNQSGAESVDITDQVTFEYSIEGTLANGKAYSSVDITNGMPREAGDYTITVTAVSRPDTDHKYRGTMEHSFSIAQRPVVIKVNDLEIRTEDKLPERSDYSYEIAGMGLLDGESLVKEPTFTCDIQNTDLAGQYDIVASDADAGFNYRITYEPGKLTVIEKEIAKTRNLLRSITPAPVINVENGTPIDKIVLPKEVAIVTREIGAEETELTEKNETAAVEWERAAADGTSYSALNEAEQTFIMAGTLVLPAEIDENGVDLRVTVQVNVREKYTVKDRVASPTANIASGSAVRRGTMIALSCETEGAEIYYTLDSTPPGRGSTLYANPIEVRVNGFTVIWAVAYKKGQPDSAAVKFYYYINTNAGGEGEEPEVPDEDIPDDGIIPEGLWVTKIPQYTYTGKAIKPEIRVYDYKTRLVEKKDYTISYANNTKAADQNADKAPTITITGKGNYEGKLVKHFTIEPKDIRDTDVSLDDITVAYNSKKSQKPVPAVLWNGKKLAAKKDYAVQDVSYQDTGSYVVAVNGIGNYKGERTFRFTITEGKLVSKLTVSKIPNQSYTGQEIKPQITVKEKNKVLTLNEDYTVIRYENNKNVGTAAVVIEGKGSYAGTRKITFKIVEIASLSKAKAELQFVNTPAYTGKPVKADKETVTINIKEDGKTVTRTLEKGTDYEVVYTNNEKAGTATATFTGKGAYSGKIKKSFKITAFDIGRVSIRLDKSYSYVKGGCKPEPTVTFAGKTLKAGTDYTLAYKQNNTVGNKAVLTVRGKGNFKGTAVREYEITQRNLEVGIGSDKKMVKVTAADKVYQNKKNVYKTTVQVTDINGKKLAAGKDYDKNVVYTYAEDVNNKEAKFYKKAGDPVDQNDIIPAGTEIKVTVTATGADYTGTVSGRYRIVNAGITGAKAVISGQSYTGKPVTLDEKQIQVTLQGTPLKYGVDYEILEDTYSNNINKGTARVTIHGLGNYGSTKVVTFKIKGKGLFSLF